MEAADRLMEKGIDTEVISVHTLKPFDKEFVIETAKRYSRIYSVEEHSIHGGLGGMIAEVLTEQGIGTRLIRIGMEDTFAKGYGTRKQVLAANKLDANGILEKIVNS